MNKSLYAVVGLLAIAGAPIAARADLILGELDIAGTAQISLGQIGFAGNAFTITSPASAGTSGTIQNLMDPPDAAGVPLNVSNFMTFTSHPEDSITLTFLAPGIDGSAGCAASPAAAGQICTPDQPTQSPFNLQNVSATSSTASFSLLGTEVDSATGETATVTGLFTTQFESLSYQDLLAQVFGGGTVSKSFSATFFITPNSGPVAPEPSTVIELVLGALCLGIGKLQLSRKKSEQ